MSVGSLNSAFDWSGPTAWLLVRPDGEGRETGYDGRDVRVMGRLYPGRMRIR